MLGGGLELKELPIKSKLNEKRSFNTADVQNKCKQEQYNEGNKLQADIVNVYKQKYTKHAHFLPFNTILVFGINLAFFLPWFGINRPR